MIPIVVRPVFTPPGWLAEALDGGAHAFIEHGRRAISWRVHNPDGIMVHRNRFVWAWFSLAEDDAFVGDKLRFRAERRITEQGMRESFTEHARDRMRVELSGAVARYGFGKLWDELHQAAASGEYADRHAAEAHRISVWYAEQAELLNMYHDGHVTIRPFTYDRNQRAPRVDYVDTRGWTTDVPEATLWHDQTQIGWIVNHMLVPTTERHTS